MAKAKPIAGTPDDPTSGFEELILEDLKSSDREDGKWWLLWNFAAIARVEKATGVNLLAGVAGFLVDTGTINDYISLLYGCLLTAHPKVTFVEVSELFRFDQLNEIRLALIKTINRSLPEKKKIQFEFVGKA